jgi:LmbE family N-acetylglucosaminyl deacetylase
MINAEEKTRVLVLAAHTDDGEFGCGGTIAKLVEQGALVKYVAFSIAEESVGPGFARDILASEVARATAALGIARENLIVHRFPVRNFPLHRQEILEIMVRLNSEFAPNVVFLPSPRDTHQDHQVVASEGFRAFKKTSMLGYEIPWNNLEFETTGFSSLAKEHIDLKVRALKAYISQLGRGYVTEEFIVSLASVRGAQVGESYAEAFEVIRWRL